MQEYRKILSSFPSLLEYSIIDWLFLPIGTVIYLIISLYMLSIQRK